MICHICQGVCAGTAHSAAHLPCQDKLFVLRTPEVSVCALSDGAGSRSQSHLGAACATQTVCEYLSAHFEEAWAQDPDALAPQLVDTCLAAFEQLEPPLYDLGCTLLFAALHRDGRLLTGHLGDGIMIRVADGRTAVYSPPENGEYHNETFFLTGVDAVSHLRLQKDLWSSPQGLLLMSDGTAESLYQYDSSTPAPACVTLAQWVRGGDEPAVNAALQRVLEEQFSKHSPDDLSLIVLWAEEEGPCGPDI